MRTGVASLRSLPAADQLALAFGALPRQTLVPPLLHEILHHVCANSAVNVAMQGRWLALLRQALSHPAFGAAIAEAHLDDLADISAAEAVLQPLAEGLALFAEFDCPLTELHGEAHGISDHILDCLHTTMTEGGPDMHDRVRQQQVDARMVARKTDVVCNPVFPEAGNDTYLLGYLIVRSLWSKLRDEAGAPIRPAHLLDFLVYYVFEDWVLAAILVTRRPGSRDAAIARLAARLRRLFSCDLGASVHALFADRERRSQRGYLARGLEEITHGPFAGLDLSMDELRAGMSALITFEQRSVDATAGLDESGRIKGLVSLVQQSLVQPLPAEAQQLRGYLDRNPKAKGAVVRAVDLILEIPQRKRPFCHLVDLEVAVAADGEQDLRVGLPGDGGSGHLLPGAAARGWPREPRSGRLFVVLSSSRTPWYLLCFIISSDQVIAAWTQGADDPHAIMSDEGMGIVETVASEIQMERETELSFVGLNRYFIGGEADAAVAEQSAAATRAIAAALRAILSEQGWGALVDAQAAGDFGLTNLVGSVRQVRALAMAGLGDSLALPKVELARALDQAGYDLGELLAAAREVERRTGITLLRDGDQRVVSQV